MAVPQPSPPLPLAVDRLATQQIESLSEKDIQVDKVETTFPFTDTVWSVFWVESLYLSDNVSDGEQMSWSQASPTYSGM